MIDSHCHLEMKEFDHDRSEVIERGEKNGITHMITVGTDLMHCRKVINIAQTYPAVYAAIGIHPHFAKDIDQSTYDELRKLAKKDKVVAFGEIGLDFFRNISPRDVQIKGFKEQINLAGELNLPLIIHDRDAHQEILAILSEEKKQGAGGIIHCFSGDYSMARQCLDMGFYIAVSTTVTYKKNHQLRDIVKKLPMDRLLVETDSPYLAPSPHRGKRNEPSFVKYGAEKIAEIKGITLKEAATITSQNTLRALGMKMDSEK